MKPMRKWKQNLWAPWRSERKITETEFAKTGRDWGKKTTLRQKLWRKKMRQNLWMLWHREEKVNTGTELWLQKWSIEGDDHGMEEIQISMRG